MEDLIYIIALIAWVVFAFYRKSQKKASANEARPPARPREAENPMPTLEEILLGRERQIQPEPVSVPSVELTDGMSPVLRETTFEKEYKLMGISSVEELGQPNLRQENIFSDIQKDDLTVQHEKDVEHQADFDLRRAVIYAEILNRPYV